MQLDLTKRQKIVVASILVTLGLLSTQLTDFNLRFRFIIGLACFAYLLSLWALWMGLDKLKAVMLFILPTFYTIAVASFYFLLPVRWVTRLPVAVFFGFTFYLLLLAQNVFNVAAVRTIPLYRAASTAAFLFTLITAFFIYNVIYAFNLFFLWNGVFVAIISFPLILQLLWSIEMEDKVSASITMQSLILSLILGELGAALSFWPIATTMWALTLASSMYVSVGLMTQFLRNRVSGRIVGEYLVIGCLVLVVSFLTTSWIG